MSRRLRWTVWLGLCVLAGCGGGGGSSSGSAGGSSTSNSTSGSSSGASTAANVIPVTVGAGPAAANRGTFNIPYVSVTLCQPGTSTCATIDNVLVDTGSAGLRIMASALADSGLSLTNMPDPLLATNTIAECLPFADGYTWGPVAAADVTLGGELASNVSVNIIDDDQSYAATAPTSCSTGLSPSPTPLNTVKAFAANGVLGVDVFDQDCGSSCAYCASLVPDGCNTKNSDLYYSCGTTASSCAFTQVSETAQVRNPVALFATDNNGVILALLSIPPGGQTIASGTLTFGISTEANNALGSAFVLTADDRGEFTTSYKNQTLARSFIDSGSNGLYFPDSSITVCPNTASNHNASDFYCPAATLSETATMTGHDSLRNPTGIANPVKFDVASLNSINGTFYASPSLAGPAATNAALGNYFDWGLPFFYGKRVYTAIEGKSAGTATGPFYAYD